MERSISKGTVCRLGEFSGRPPNNSSCGPPLFFVYFEGNKQSLVLSGFCSGREWRSS